MTDGICVGNHRSDPDRLRPSVPGTHLCDGCRSRLSAALVDVTAKWLALASVMVGPSGERVTDDPWPLTAAENPLPLKQHIAQHRVDAVQKLSSWHRLVAEERGHGREQRGRDASGNLVTAWVAVRGDIASTSAYLLNNLDWIVRQEWVADFMDEVLPIVGRAKALLDTGQRGFVFLGPCLIVTDGHGECQAEIYAPEEADETTCGTCGALVDVGERREWLRESLRIQLGTVAEVADFASSYHGRRIPEETVKTWAKRDKIRQHGKDAQGRGLYSVEEVILHAAQSPASSRRAG